MEHPVIVAAIRYISGMLEFVGVGVIVIAFLYALVRAAARIRQPREDAYERLRVFLGKSLLLGLEFLVAADIIQTVLMDSGMRGILSLGLLVVVRIVLGWSIAVEIEGCWPWQVAASRRDEGRGSREGV